VHARLGRSASGSYAGGGTNAAAIPQPVAGDDATPKTGERLAHDSGFSRLCAPINDFVAQVIMPGSSEPRAPIGEAAAQGIKQGFGSPLQILEMSGESPDPMDLVPYAHTFSMRGPQADEFPLDDPVLLLMSPRTVIHEDDVACDPALSAPGPALVDMDHTEDGVELALTPLTAFQASVAVKAMSPSAIQEPEASTSQTPSMVDVRLAHLSAVAGTAPVDNAEQEIHSSPGSPSLPPPCDP
jgi:hypothetical protein